MSNLAVYAEYIKSHTVVERMRLIVPLDRVEQVKNTIIEEGWSIEEEGSVRHWKRVPWWQIIAEREVETKS